MITIIQCPDKVGLVADVSRVLAEAGLNITALDEYVDKTESRFFLRLETEQSTDVTALEQQLKAVLGDEAIVSINPLPQKRVVVMVTKEYHCLADILVRNYFGTLGASIACVIGNYNNLKDVCRRFDIPFFLASHEQKTKAGFENDIVSVISDYQPDFIVLAKFMRILSPDFVASHAGKIINIHHSFLPAFIGANPYRQAYERGVKMIGATAHFVTNDLDEGPIITQQIIPVNHAHTAADMMKAGREIETAVLAKALQLVFEDRVMVFKNKTVVFG